MGVTPLIFSVLSKNSVQGSGSYKLAFEDYPMPSVVEPPGLGSPGSVLPEADTAFPTGMRPLGIGIGIVDPWA